MAHMCVARPRFQIADVMLPKHPHPTTNIARCQRHIVERERARVSVTNACRRVCVMIGKNGFVTYTNKNLLRRFAHGNRVKIHSLQTKSIMYQPTKKRKRFGIHDNLNAIRVSNIPSTPSTDLHGTVSLTLYAFYARVFVARLRICGVTHCQRQGTLVRSVFCVCVSGGGLICSLLARIITARIGGLARRALESLVHVSCTFVPCADNGRIEEL